MSALHREHPKGNAYCCLLHASCKSCTDVRHL